jgi:hypothetical protein
MEDEMSPFESANFVSYVVRKLEDARELLDADSRLDELDPRQVREALDAINYEYDLSLKNDRATVYDLAHAIWRANQSR